MTLASKKNKIFPSAAFLAAALIQAACSPMAPSGAKGMHDSSVADGLATAGGTAEILSSSETSYAIVSAALRKQIDGLFERSAPFIAEETSKSLELAARKGHIAIAEMPEKFLMELRSGLEVTVNMNDFGISLKTIEKNRSKAFLVVSADEATVDQLNENFEVRLDFRKTTVDKSQGSVRLRVTARSRENGQKEGTDPVKDMELSRALDESLRKVVLVLREP